MGGGGTASKGISRSTQDCVQFNSCPLSRLERPPGLGEFPRGAVTPTRPRSPVLAGQGVGSHPCESRPLSAPGRLGRKIKEAAGGAGVTGPACLNGRVQPWHRSGGRRGSKGRSRRPPPLPKMEWDSGPRALWRVRESKGAPGPTRGLFERQPLLTENWEAEVSETDAAAIFLPTSAAPGGSGSACYSSRFESRPPGATLNRTPDGRGWYVGPGSGNPCHTPPQGRPHSECTPKAQHVLTDVLASQSKNQTSSGGRRIRLFPRWRHKVARRGDWAGWLPGGSWRGSAQGRAFSKGKRGRGVVLSPVAIEWDDCNKSECEAQNTPSLPLR